MSWVLIANTSQKYIYKYMLCDSCVFKAYADKAYMQSDLCLHCLFTASLDTIAAKALIRL